jgi:peptidoglycan hydrolase-like protein with peptidoglycan-binding domain
MNMVTTKAKAKVAAVATGLAMATSMLALAPMAHAALSSSQVQSILSLLSSFGADASTIANVQASLTGGTPVMTPPTSSYTFTRDLKVGSRGADVTALQQALMAKGFSIPAGATGYFGSQTVAAVIAWQKSAGVSPAVGYFGSLSRAAFGGGSMTTNPPPPVMVGSGLMVSLAATSPNGTVLVAGQGIGVLADYMFTNPSSSPINVTGLSFKRIGVSNDSTMTNVYLYNAGTRITDSAGVSSSSFSFSDSVALFTVPANGSYTVSVRSDILTGTSGQQIGVQLVSATSNGTLASSVSFPINSGMQTISAATLATVNFSVQPTPTAATSISPQSDYPVWQDTVVVSSNPVKLASLKFTNLGSIDSSAISNIRLYVDGVMVGSAQAMGANRSVTFDLSASPVLLSTQSHIVKVLANITGGASRTLQLSIQRSSDGMFIDNQLNQPVTPQYIGTTFGAVTTGVITMSSVTTTSGTSVSLAPTSPNTNVAVGASNIKWASFNMLASGENVKINDLYVYASSTTSGGALAGVGGLQNGKIYLNGVQVGSTKNIGSLVAGVTDFALGSSLILPAGQTVMVDIYADAKDTAGTNLPANSTVIVSLNAGSSNAQGMTSLNAASIPAAITSSNTITVVASSLTATKYTGYGNQTMIAGAQNAKIGAFTLSAGQTEGVTVNTIVFSLANVTTSTLTNLVLKDEATGTQIGSTLTTPSGTAAGANSFAVTLDVPASSTKTIGIYANILSGANAGSIVATIGTGTTGTGMITGTSASAASTALQTITIGSGTLAITAGAGAPTSTNIVAGVASVKVGQFNFAGANSSYTVQDLAVLVPNGAATSVTNVTVSYKDVNGATQTQTQPLSFSTTVPATIAPFATATFTGLTMYVPANDSANLDVFVGTPTVASGATSGSAIIVTLDVGATSGTFRALNGAGVAITAPTTPAANLTGNTFYVRKSVPTFAMVPVTATVPTTGNALYRFSITSDAAGAIEWTHLKFNLATSSTAASNMLTSVYLVDEASPAVNLLDSTATAQALYASTTATAFTVDLTKNSTAATYQQVAAGSTKTYNLMGTVAGFTTGSTLTISLASDGATVANGTAGGLASATVGTIWSDRSAASHSITTSDWTNGYLLNNFTSNATSYSK